jgi:hypothetical protein
MQDSDSVVHVSELTEPVSAKTGRQSISKKLLTTSTASGRPLLQGALGRIKSDEQSSAAKARRSHLHQQEGVVLVSKKDASSSTRRSRPHQREGVVSINQK